MIFSFFSKAAMKKRKVADVVSENGSALFDGKFELIKV